VHQLRPPDDPPDEDLKTASPYAGFPRPREDLPYKVEICDASGEFAELVVAVTLSPAIGYAAYYAATREYPGRSIVLRHKGSVISRWSGQGH
jgi:hypothetical protein